MIDRIANLVLQRPGRHTSLAWLNLAHQPTRTAVSISGIGFAILLMFMQLGFLGSVGDTATLVYRRMPCDIIIRSSEYLDVYDPRSIDASALNRLMTVEQIVDVRPLDLAVARWQNPNTGEFRAVAMIGIDTDRPGLRIAGIDPVLPLLRRPDHVLVDRASRADFGPLNGYRFCEDDVGRTTTINDKQVTIVGMFEMGTGLAANGAVLASRDAFRRLALEDHEERVSMILVSLADGVSIQQGLNAVSERLRLGGGSLAFADVISRAEAEAAERRHWYVETPVGIIFWIGVGLAIIVGGVICYMVLAADVIAHLPEYATLKAMGYSNRYLSRTLLSQAGYLATIALPPATLLSIGLYRLTSLASGLPIRMTWLSIVLVTVMTFVMCGVAGLLTMRKLRKAEPASLF